MADSQDLDRWFSSAKSCEELYDLINTGHEYVARELYRRIPDLRQ